MKTLQEYKRFRNNINNNIEDIITVLEMAKTCDELRKESGKPPLDLLSILQTELMRRCLQRKEKYYDSTIYQKDWR